MTTSWFLQDEKNVNLHNPFYHQFGIFASCPIQLARHIGGIGVDKTTSVKVVNNGNVIMAGSFEGTVDFDPGVGSHVLTATGTHDIFVSKYDSSGNFIWAKHVK